MRVNSIVRRSRWSWVQGFWSAWYCSLRSRSCFPRRMQALFGGRGPGRCLERSVRVKTETSKRNPVVYFDFGFDCRFFFCLQPTTGAETSTVQLQVFYSVPRNCLQLTFWHKHAWKCPDKRSDLLCPSSTHRRSTIAIERSLSTSDPMVIGRWRMRSSSYFGWVRRLCSKALRNRGIAMLCIQLHMTLLLNTSPLIWVFGHFWRSEQWQPPLTCKTRVRKKKARTTTLQKSELGFSCFTIFKPKNEKFFSNEKSWSG